MTLSETLSQGTRAAPATAAPLAICTVALDAIGLSSEVPGLKLFSAAAPAGTCLAPSSRRSKQYKMVQHILDRRGHQLGTLMHNGPEGRRGHIEIVGPEASHWFERIKQIDTHCRVTRRDEAWDFPELGAFKRVSAVMLAVKKKHRVRSFSYEDEDFPQDGASYYLGRPGSRVLVRGYERGLHPDHRHEVRNPNLTRLEIQVKPQGPGPQAAARTWAPGDIWGVRDWTRDLAKAVLGISATPVVIQPGGRATDDDKMLWNVVARSGKRLARLADELGGWDQLGLSMQELFVEHTQRRS